MRTGSWFRPAFWGLAAALATGGCSKRDDAAKATPAPPALPESPAANTPPAQTAKEPPGPAAPAPSPALPDHDIVFFIEGSELFVPLACYVAERRTLAGGADCLSLVTLPAKLGHARTGTTVHITDRQIDVCHGDGSEYAVLAAAPEAEAEHEPEPKPEAKDDAKDDAAHPDYLVWPATEKVPVAYAPAPTEENMEVPSAERARLENAIKGWAPAAKGQLIIDQRVPEDVDGDGKAEVFYAAYIPTVVDGEIDDSEHQWSGFVLAPGAKPDALVQLFHSKLERLHLIGSLDLNRDGARELWYESHYYEGSYQIVGRVQGNKLELLGSYGCGA